VLGWGVRVQSPTAPYWELLTLAFLAGIGGGAFSGFMPSTSYFFPRKLQGTALGLQAGIGNFGVSLVQLLTPWLVGFGLIGFLGASQHLHVTGKPDITVWYQNAAFFYIPFIIVGAILAWLMLKSVPITANIRQQFDIFRNQDTWWMTLLYIMTFGTFSGLSAQFGLLMSNLYGAGNAAIVSGTGAAAKFLVAGYALPDPRQVRIPRPSGRRWRPGAVLAIDRPDGRRSVDAHLRHRARRVGRLDHPCTGAGHEQCDRPPGWLQPLLVGHARDLPLHGHRERRDLQADADDLRAPPSRWRHRVDQRDRRVWPVPVRRRPHPDAGPGLLRHRRRMGAHVRGRHLAPVRTSK